MNWNMSISSPGASPANLLAAPDKKRESMTPATSGLECLKLSNTFGPVGLFLKMLVTSPAWYSKACSLTWKLKNTPFNRSIFQLAPLAPRISGKDSLLLPTPLRRDARAGVRQPDGKRGISLIEIFGYFPTPLRSDWKGGIGGNKQRNLRAFINKRLLPTPRRRDYKGSTQRGKFYPAHSLPDKLYYETNTKGNGKVNPNFYEWCMGFPFNYTHPKKKTGNLPDWTEGTFKMPPPLTEKKDYRILRIQALGNAVVPQIPFVIFNIIKEIEEMYEV
jgi:hypothetical protein